MFASSGVLRKIGYFDEGFFLYFADTDWAKRASEKGTKMKIVPSSKVYHQISGTTSKVKGKVEYYTLRDSLFFIKKHYSFPVVFYSFIISVVRSALSLTNYHRRKVIKYILLAYWHFILGKRGKYDLYYEKA